MRYRVLPQVRQVKTSWHCRCSRPGARSSDAEIRRRAACTLDFSIGFEVLPDPQDRLTLSSEKKDPLGIPHPVVTYNIGDYVRTGGDKVRPTLQHIASLLEATR